MSDNSNNDNDKGFNGKSNDNSDKKRISNNKSSNINNDDLYNENVDKTKKNNKYIYIYI